MANFNLKADFSCCKALTVQDGTLCISSLKLPYFHSTYQHHKIHFVA